MLMHRQEDLTSSTKSLVQQHQIISLTGDHTTFIEHYSDISMTLESYQLLVSGIVDVESADDMPLYNSQLTDEAIGPVLKAKKPTKNQKLIC